MGIDTRFFGGSAWQLYHYVSFHAKHPNAFLLGMKDVLPCKFCRKSSTKFIQELPLRSDVAMWLYELHNKVNHKLRTQCQNDPAVINPGIDPTFDEIKQKYEHMNPTKGILGRDFLFSVASNYPTDPTPSQIDTQKTFLTQLADVYPIDIKQYIRAHPPALDSKQSYQKWMYGLLESINPRAIPTYNGYVQRLSYYTSGCDKKTYKGKTCRRVGSGRGRLTKNRDHRKTHKITHSVLL